MLAAARKVWLGSTDSDTGFLRMGNAEISEINMISIHRVCVHHVKEEEMIRRRDDQNSQLEEMLAVGRLAFLNRLLFLQISAT